MVRGLFVSEYTHCPAKSLLILDISKPSPITLAGLFNKNAVNTANGYSELRLHAVSTGA